MARKISANSGKTEKRQMPHGKRFQPGQSGNPSGRPKNEISITHWLKEFGAMTSEQVAEACQQYAKEFKALKTGDIPLAGIAALRWWMAVVSEPTPGLLGHALDRIDGPVTTKVETWQDRLIDLLRQGKVNPEDVVSELGTELAAPIIAAAGLRPNGHGETTPSEPAA